MLRPVSKNNETCRGLLLEVEVSRVRQGVGDARCASSDLYGGAKARIVLCAGCCDECSSLSSEESPKTSLCKGGIGWRLKASDLVLENVAM